VRAPLAVDLGDHRLEARWHGPGPREAPTLVFLHAGLRSASAWRAFPARLAAATRFGALVYSRRGYGGSDRALLPRPVSFMHAEALETLPRVLERYEIADPILVGESDGASIALIYAGSGAAPRPRALLLESPHVFVEEVCLSSIAAGREDYARGELRRRLARHHATDVDETFHGWCDVWLEPAFRSWDLGDLLPRIAAPTLAIQGEDDPFGTLRQVERLAAESGGFVELRIRPGVGHSPHRDEPDATRDAMVRFLEREVPA
jgi:pimeloyl-ACP methyl ester carboxylesterase